MDRKLQSFDFMTNKLCISKNKDYIKNFYGKNILDVMAIIGDNGSGKTTITKCLYNICDSVHPCEEDKQYPTNNTKRLLVYESYQKGKEAKLIIHYYLSEKPKIYNETEYAPIIIDLKDIEGEELKQAMQQHEMTTVYFTNAFEINDSTFPPKKWA